MMDVEQKEAELEIAKLVAKDPELRAAAYADEATAEDIAAFKALNAEIAVLNTAYKEKWPPPPPAEGDAAATPQAVVGGVGSVGPASEGGE